MLDAPPAQRYLAAVIEIAPKAVAALMGAAVVGCALIPACGGNVVVDAAATSSSSTSSSGALESEIARDCAAFYGAIEANCCNQPTPCEPADAVALCINAAATLPPPCVALYEATFHCYVVNIQVFVAARCNIYELTGLPGTPCIAEDNALAACDGDGG
jgi:hypothetical protein